MASFAKEDNPGLAKRPWKINGRLANRGITSLVKETTGALLIHCTVGNHSTIQQQWNE